MELLDMSLTSWNLNKSLVWRNYLEWNLNFEVYLEVMEGLGFLVEK